jgi:hypothetical protein
MEKLFWPEDRVRVISPDHTHGCVGTVKAIFGKRHTGGEYLVKLDRADMGALPYDSHELETVREPHVRAPEAETSLRLA